MLVARIGEMSEWLKEHAWTMGRMPECRERQDAESDKCVALFRREIRRNLRKLIHKLKFGEMSEWLKEHAWKVCIR